MSRTIAYRNLEDYLLIDNTIKEVRKRFVYCSSCQTRQCPRCLEDRTVHNNYACRKSLEKHVKRENTTWRTWAYKAFNWIDVYEEETKNIRLKFNEQFCKRHKSYNECPCIVILDTRKNIQDIRNSLNLYPYEYLEEYYEKLKTYTPRAILDIKKKNIMKKNTNILCIESCGIV